jgi:hypothetical protein
MYVLPPAANSLVPVIDSPWLPPIRFGVKPYLDLCRSFDQALAELEARYPSHRPVLTLSIRNKRFRRRPK